MFLTAARGSFIQPGPEPIVDHVFRFNETGRLRLLHRLAFARRLLDFLTATTTTSPATTARPAFLGTRLFRNRLVRVIKAGRCRRGSLPQTGAKRIIFINIRRRPAGAG